MRRLLGDAAVPSRRPTQYDFLYGAGVIYHNGWKASFGYRPDFGDLFGTYPHPPSAEYRAGKEVWELYIVEKDPTELNELAASEPAKLKEMKALFEAEAEATDLAGDQYRNPGCRHRPRRDRPPRPGAAWHCANDPHQ